MLRKLWWISLLAIALPVVAQDASIDGAYGTGVASNSNTGDPNAHFRFAVKRMTRGDQSRISGEFHFRARDVDNHRAVEIAMPNVGRLEVGDNTASFAGPAVMTATTRQGTRRVRGHVVVQVADNRDADSNEGDPDGLSVRFFAGQNTDPAFAYRGRVVRGDIVVFHRP
jgi:hypothetical protein